MNKTDFINLIATKLNSSKAEAARNLDVVLRSYD